MGNVSSMARASTSLDSYVAELGNDISYDKSLSSSRFLKTILARHAYGPLVLKIFIKPEATMSLRSVQRRLKSQRDALGDLPGINTYQTFVETEKAGYLIRQWVGSNLYDRVSTQPYLADVEKKWIAFQLLTCLRDARLRKVAHGDIKSENVLITSDLTVLLTDFSSSLKPTYLPLDDPSDFSYFFDTSTRRTCYIAPERFYAADSPMAEQKKAMAAAARDFPDGDNWGKRDGKVTEEMDVFSAGCVLAEMWTDGRTVFNLSELYAYRDGSLGLGGILDNLEDDGVKNMISIMLSKIPEDRPTFDRILSAFRGTIFPEYFYIFLEDYCNSLSELPERSEKAFLQKTASQPGNKIDRLLEEWESITVHLEGTGGSSDGPALLLLNIVTSSLRNSIWPSSRLHGLQLFLNLCPYLSDEDKVDRIVPYIVELLVDDVAVVRAEACRTLVVVVESVKSVTPQNSTFIPEYLLPQIRQLASDPDVFVRTTYARGLVKLAEAAVNLLEMSHAAKPTSHRSENPDFVEPDYDTMLQEIQSLIEEQTTALLVDPSSSVKRAMLSSIPDLCLFFGRQKANETVLSHIMTYLNDRDWLLRLSFFDGIVGVGAFIGVKAIEEYVLPLMLQALADSEEAVVAKVIGSMANLASLGLLPRMQVWEVFFAVRGFLCHPNIWIRQNTAGFVSSASKTLPSSDVWCILYPSVRPLLRADILELDEDSLISALISPLPRTSLTAAKTAALQNSPQGYWDVPQGMKSGFVKAIDAPKSSKTQVNLQNTRLRFARSQLKDRGITPQDERKILALKEFIVKQAYASKARETGDSHASPEAALMSGKMVSLTDLGVTPQTVFISPRTIGVDARLDTRRLRPDLPGSSSRRTSFASRSNRGGVDKPLDEIRKRLVSLEIPSRVMENQAVEPTMPPPDASPSDSLLSSTLDISAIPHGRRKGDSSKAAPAIGTVHTSAVATTTIHDEPPSGRSTPTVRTTRSALAPYSSTYEGQDPGVKAFLEQVDLDNYREPLLDFGPRVTASHRKKGPRAKSSTALQGVTLIAHLTQHSGSITGIVASPDNLFFATSSEDGQVLIWDTARLERSVSAKPRLAYRMDAPVTAMCRIENTHCLAVASEDGQLHVLRIHVVSGTTSAKYGKIEVIRTWRADSGDGHVIFVSHLQDSSLLILTSTSVIAQVDIRSMGITTRFQHPLELGLITAICPSGEWIVVGSSNGSLCLWDLRFGLLLKSWRASGGITSCQIHPAKGAGRWIMVGVERANSKATPSPMVEVYDIETSKLMEVYEVRTTKPNSKTLTPSDASTADDIPTKAQMIADLATAPLGFPRPESSADAVDPKPQSVLTLIVGHGFAALPGREEDMLMSVPEANSLPSTNPGWLVTAGEDRVVRYWDLSRPSEGFVICGSPKEKDVSFRHLGTSVPNIYYTVPISPRHSLGDSRHASNTLRQPLRPHYDTICALGSVETPFSSCVVSADRSGVVKVWRMEVSTGART